MSGPKRTPIALIVAHNDVSGGYWALLECGHAIAVVSAKYRSATCLYCREGYTPKEGTLAFRMALRGRRMLAERGASGA